MLDKIQQKNGSPNDKEKTLRMEDRLKQLAMTVELNKRQMNSQTVRFESVLKMDHVVRMDMILHPMGTSLVALNQDELSMRFERELKWFGEVAE